MTVRIFVILPAFLLACCTRDHLPGKERGRTDETTLQQARADWPEMPQQITFIGLKDCPTKFQVYWNGALSCFTGRDCFGKVFPPQREISRQYENDRLHLSLAVGAVPDFPLIDSGQVEQSIPDAGLPVVRTSWSTGGAQVSVLTLATALEPAELDPEARPGMALSMMRIGIRLPENATENKADLWINLSGYMTLVPTRKEGPDDVFPAYGRKLRLDGNTLLDERRRIRLVVSGPPPGTRVEFFDEYANDEPGNQDLQLARHKGFLKNLLHVEIPCEPGHSVRLVVILPYFPVPGEKAMLLQRDFDTELLRVRRYWESFYRKDALIETPDSFVNDLYRAGLWHALVTSDFDPATGMVYAKSSPAWYETIWPNCAMVTARSMDLRGQHEVARQILEPFLDWQGVRNPPNMSGASSDGFLCPPEDYCAIPWVSNHGNILFALCEHYRLTRDTAWAQRITPLVLRACDWIIEQRMLTRGQEFGAGLLPGGTVSDDRGSGQYLCSDAQNYRGLRAAARFLEATGQIRAGEIERAAADYREDLLDALSEATARNDSVTLAGGRRIPFVPAEIGQTAPPEFDQDNFWPWINYVDVGPMNLVDCGVLDAGDPLAQSILEFEASYPVARLQHPISLTENWVKSIRLPGDSAAFLLHRGISVVEPFYSPRSACFLEQDRIASYLEVFYNQLAAGVSHKNLSPCENRYGVWFMPWADGEFHRMLLRMLADAGNDSLVLLRAIPERWLQDGNKLRVKRQPTGYGPLEFRLASHLRQGYIELQLGQVPQNVPGGIRIRFRHPRGKAIRRVELNGQEIDRFSDEYVSLDNPPPAPCRIRVFY